MNQPPLDSLAQALGLSCGELSYRSTGSGFLPTGRLEHPSGDWFVKSAPIDQSDPLLAEADGLKRLAAAGRVSVPAIRGCFRIENAHWLVLEWIDLQPLSGAGAVQLGRQLATLHRDATSTRHGLDRDNWIGATPQVNTPAEDWAAFFFDHRLDALIDRLGKQGAEVGPETSNRLRDAWSARFCDYRPIPSLLHGDLWGGNAGQLPDGRPVVFDPAVHYGDRECDLAMASLFGGFDTAFFDAYQAAWPLEPDWQLRGEYYQLYHVLNHALLFGGGYMADARRRIARLVGDTS